MFLNCEICGPETTPIVVFAIGYAYDVELFVASIMMNKNMAKRKSRKTRLLEL